MIKTVIYGHVSKHRYDDLSLPRAARSSIVVMYLSLSFASAKARFLLFPNEGCHFLCSPCSRENCAVRERFALEKQIGNKI